MNIRTKINNYVSRRRAIRELNAMDDRSLSDVGVRRDEIKTWINGR